MAIKDWHSSLQPREKLLDKGAEVLSDAELLAIFLRVGVKGASAIDLSIQLLEHFGSLRKLIKAKKDEFCSIHGLGEAKYVLFQAMEELAKRLLNEPLIRGQLLNSSQEVKRLLQLELREEPRELFQVLFLDNQHHLISRETLFYGTINCASVYPREVLRRVIDLNASSVILAHNHPSGVPDPSLADIRMTKQLTDLLKVVDVRILDHLVVGDMEVVSMSELGML